MGRRGITAPPEVGNRHRTQGDSMTKPNTLLIHDTLYTMTPAYIAGARACRDEVPHWANPHADGTQDSYDWSFAHDNEAAGEHRRFGKDLLDEHPASVEFGMDPDIARDDNGEPIAA